MFDGHYSGALWVAGTRPVADLHAVAAAFAGPADYRRAHGLLSTARLLRGAATALRQGDPRVRSVCSWRGDPDADSLLRFAAALHAPVPYGVAPDLAVACPGRGTSVDDARLRALALAALLDPPEVLAACLGRPPQIVVGRSAMLLGGFLKTVDLLPTPLPLHLLELGASAGLILQWGRHRHRLGALDRAKGGASPASQWAPAWQGLAPSRAPLRVVERAARPVARPARPGTGRGRCARPSNRLAWRAGQRAMPWFVTPSTTIRGLGEPA